MLKQSKLYSNIRTILLTLVWFRNYNKKLLIGLETIGLETIRLDMIWLEVIGLKMIGLEVIGLDMIR